MPVLRTIISGDLVSSTRLKAAGLDEAMAALQSTAAEIEGWYGVPVLFTRNRGDGWQICLPPTSVGLREALAMRAGLKRANRAYDTRLAIATDLARLPEDGNLNEASGPAFTRAGRLLDTLTGAEFDHVDSGALSAAVILAGDLSRGWTQAQARAVLPMLAPEPPTHADIAARYDITRQAIHQALTGASYPALIKAIARTEETP